MSFERDSRVTYLEVRGLPLPRVAVLALAMLTLGCPNKSKSKEGDPLVIAEIEVIDRSSPSEKLAEMTPRSVRLKVEQWLRSSPKLKVDATRKGAVYRLRIEFGIGAQQTDDGPVTVALVSGRAAVLGDSEAIVLQSSAITSMSGKARAAQDKAIQLNQTLKDVIGDISYQAELVVAPEADLVAALSATREDRLLSALEIVAMRRPKSALPQLTRLLKHQKERVVDRAIGALVAIGDRKAVKPLTQLAKFSDTRRLAKLIDGVGSLGGKQAVDYLSFIAVGHEDADIRNLSREALQRMKRKSPGKSPER